MHALIILAALALPERPDWWRVPPFDLSSNIEYRETPTEMCLSLRDADKLASTLAKAEQFAGVVEYSLDQLWAYHAAVGEQLKATAAFDAQQARAEASAESESRWPRWQVAILAVGAGAAGVLVGGLLVLGQQAIAR